MAVSLLATASAISTAERHDRSHSASQFSTQRAYLVTSKACTIISSLGRFSTAMVQA